MPDLSAADIMQQEIIEETSDAGQRAKAQRKKMKPTVHLGGMGDLGLFGRTLTFGADMLKALNKEFSAPCARCKRKRTVIIGDCTNAPHYKTTNERLCDDCDDPDGSKRAAQSKAMGEWAVAHPDREGASIGISAG